MRYPTQPLALLIGLFLPITLIGCGRSRTAPESSGHEEAGHPEAIHLSQATQQELGITVLPAELKLLEQTLQVTGQIAQDTDRLAHVNAPDTGTVQQLLVTVGQRVEAQMPVAVVVSNPHQSTLQVIAPRAGLVLGVHTNVGASVDQLTSLLTIADLSQVWATFDVYEQDVALVQVGQRLETQSVAYPDRVFPGKVVFVSPQVDQHTRTIKVRAQIDNADYALKLGMFVTGLLYIPTAEETLVVPHAAIQRMDGTILVFVQTAPETFVPRDVRIGQESRAGVQILEGLSAGEPVVASGSFHLKAELLKETLGEEE